MSDKDLIWLPVDVIAEIKKYEDPTSVECKKIIDKYIEKLKSEYEENLRQVDEEVAVYRGLMIQAKNSFQKAVQEQLEANYAIWEQFDQQSTDMQKKVDALVNKLKPLKDAFEQIERQINRFDRHGIDSFTQSVDNLARAMNGPAKEMIQFLVDNFKKPESL